MHSKEGESGLTVDEWVSEWVTENGDKLLFVSCVVATYLQFVIVLILQEPHFSSFIHTKKTGLVIISIANTRDGGADQGSSLNNNYFHLIYVMVS